MPPPPSEYRVHKARSGDVRAAEGCQHEENERIEHRPAQRQRAGEHKIADLHAALLHEGDDKEKDRRDEQDAVILGRQAEGIQRAVKELLRESGRFEKIVGLTDLTGKDRIVAATVMTGK